MNMHRLKPTISLSNLNGILGRPDIWLIVLAIGMR